MATKIFRHAWKMLCNNLGSAVKVSLFPIICTMVAIALDLVLLEGVPYFLEGFDNVTGTHVVMMVLVIWQYCWFAWSLIGWHRFVLLEERPNGFYQSGIVCKLRHTL